MKTMARKKANEGKVRKLMDFSKSVIDTIEKKAHGEGGTFKTYAQNIIEQHAKRLK